MGGLMSKLQKEYKSQRTTRYTNKPIANVDYIEFWRDNSLTDIDGETWLPVHGTKGKYLASSHGRVKSFYRNSSGYIKKQSKNVKSDYPYTCIKYANGDVKHKQVHRIIYESFNGETSLQVDHIDGSRTNNHIDNLRSVTNKENIRLGVEKRSPDSTIGVRFTGSSWISNIYLLGEGTTILVGSFAVRDYGNDEAKALAIACRNAAEDDIEDIEFPTKDDIKSRSSMEFRNHFGVSKSTGRFQVCFVVDGAIRYFGSFTDELDAYISGNYAKLLLSEGVAWAEVRSIIEEECMQRKKVIVAPHGVSYAKATGKYGVGFRFGGTAINGYTKGISPRVSFGNYNSLDKAIKVMWFSKAMMYSGFSKKYTQGMIKDKLALGYFDGVLS